MRPLLRIVVPAFAWLAHGLAVQAQPPFYDPGTVHDIRLWFDDPHWRETLESLYVQGDKGRLTGTLSIDGLLYTGVGVRYKGYSSVSVGRAKNPFNIKLDHTIAGQGHQGFRKLKLSNITSDPSCLRETLGYEVARDHMPASRANFATLHVNDTLIGLYTNVEAVNKDFVQRWWGDRKGSFFKGNPPVVSPSGENCNLSDSPGPDSTDYYGVYSIESDQGWGHLLELITTLNQDAEQVDQVLNVDRALWMHAFNYALINFDSYVGYAQNYYLYRDPNGRWNTIPWDLNMSFASFRLTDASLYWNGFSIANAISMDPLMHHNAPSILPRPLMRNLFADATHRRMYIAHLRTIIAGWFANGRYYDRALAMRTLIDPYVQADTNAFFSHQEFLDNLDLPVSGITTYPGIAQLMEARSAWLLGYPGYLGHPEIGAPVHMPQDLAVGETITITVAVEAAEEVMLGHRFADGGVFQRLAMHDDGLHGDGGAGDGVYGIMLTAASNLLQYYIYAQNTGAGAFLPERAEHEFFSIQTRILPGHLVINEVMALNGGVVLNEDHEASDWIELYNPGPFTVSTVGLHLSDDPASPQKWALPPRTLIPGEFMIVWADERDDLGGHHANFKLGAQGETLTLAYDADAIIDQLTFGTQYPISTTGRYPNGTGPFRELPPTFNAVNTIGLKDNVDRRLLLYPNPATTELNAIVRMTPPLETQVFGTDGRAMGATVTHATNERIRLATHGFAAGHYVLRVRSAEGDLHEPFIIIE